MSSSSASASMPAYPPPTTTKVRVRRRTASSAVDSAMSSDSMTRLRSAMASSTVLKPVPCSARPGIGRVREIDPAASTMWS